MAVVVGPVAHRDRILHVINDAAAAYRGVIPSDCWHEPYFTLDYLEHELNDRVQFYGLFHEQDLKAVMAWQDRGDVALVRHAYTLTAEQGKGYGSTLLTYIRNRYDLPLLVGTWQAAQWAIDFYVRAGFTLLSPGTAKPLLKQYWKITDQHRNASVVLADEKWLSS